MTVFIKPAINDNNNNNNNRNPETPGLASTQSLFFFWVAIYHKDDLVFVRNKESTQK